MGTKATEDDQARQAVAEKLKKAQETENVAKQALDKKKSECAASVKQFDSDIESALGKVDAATKLAAQEKEAADKATTKAGDCESGNKDQVEQLEDKLEKSANQVAADK